jgi:DNA topoisomerase VI subunit B
MDIIQNSLSAGAILVKLTVEEDGPSDRLEIIIEDNGCGMDKEQFGTTYGSILHLQDNKESRNGHSTPKQSAEQSGGGIE